jgi:GAF domain-containing protein
MATVTKSTREQALARIRKEARMNAAPSQLMRFVAEELSSLPDYNRVGFYFVSRSDPQMLQLGEFVGAPTPHTRIPLNQGICGAAVSTGETIVVDDVNRDPRYLACSIETKSEIVVPIYVHGRVAGELDIDSHRPAAFGSQDRALLEECAAIVGAALEAGAQ